MAHEVMILPVSAPVTMHPGALGSIDGISSCLPLIDTTLHLLLHSLTHSLTHLFKSSNYIRFYLILILYSSQLQQTTFHFVGLKTLPNIRQKEF
jgi:hypothetical protein